MASNIAKLRCIVNDCPRRPNKCNTTMSKTINFILHSIYSLVLTQSTMNTQLSGFRYVLLHFFVIIFSTFVLYIFFKILHKKCRISRDRKCRILHKKCRKKGLTRTRQNRQTLPLRIIMNFVMNMNAGMHKERNVTALIQTGDVGNRCPFVLDGSHQS